MSTIKFNVPTVLTISRIALIPFFVWITPSSPILGVTIFLVAAITDFLDGYLARKTGEITKFGIILDPIADKILVIAALILLVDMVRISAWVAMVIIVREFMVTGIRMVALSKDIVMSAESDGKWKAATQMVAIVLLFLPQNIGPFDFDLVGIDFYDIGLVLIYISVVLAVYSGVKTAISFWRRLQ